MNGNRLNSPALVLLAGLAAATLATVVAFAGMDATGEDLTRAVPVGVMAAIGAATMASWQRYAHHKTSESLGQARHEADHDPLTGLINRAGLHRQLEALLSQARADDSVLGVLFCDLDRFKSINDSMGHDAGDEVLRIVADRLRSSTRSTDVVARVGGDEFVVVCKGLLAEDSVVAAAEQILKRLSEPVALADRKHRVSVSVGVAIAGRDETRSPEELVRDADTAMYRAKLNRCGYLVFDPAQRSVLIDRLDLERDLNKAIGEDQFVVHYQPIVDVAGHRLYGFEALIRWQHPERGLVAPDDFLAVADDARLMSKIGEVVLREACAQAAVWSYQSPEAAGLKIGVNVAEQQLTEAGLPSLISEVLAWSGLRPEQLVVEITEDVMVEHLAGLAVLQEIRDLGVNLAIDDFGTGQSSLSYIKHFDMVTTLKIDKVFVGDLLLGGANQAIIEAIIAMAGALGLAVVAEGVESQEQMDALSRLGVNLMQGYLFSPPVAASELGDPRTWTGPLPAGVVE
jgi:diguanylate cyclase (GGDEF)-like protein